MTLKELIDISESKMDIVEFAADERNELGLFRKEEIPEKYFNRRVIGVMPISEFAVKVIIEYESCKSVLMDTYERLISLWTEEERRVELAWIRKRLKKEKQENGE